NRRSAAMIPPAMAVISADNPADQSIFQQVEQKLQELDTVWKRWRLPAEGVYETLAAAVLPEFRPGEIFLYPRPLSQGGIQQPRSVGRMLAQWAVQANRAEDLRQRLAARQNQALAELSAHVGLAQLGVAGKDVKLTVDQLEWLGQRMQKDTLRN